MTNALRAVHNDEQILHTLLTQWCLWMSAGGHSPRTIQARHDLVILLAVRTGEDPLTCGWEVVARFLGSTRLKQSSRSTYRAGLRSWFAWLMLMGHRADNPVDMLPRSSAPRGVPRPVTTDQLGQALASGRFYARTRTMILLAAYEGLRASEIAAFRGEQIRGGELRLVGKGGVDALLPLHTVVAAEAEHYPEIGPWFPSPADRSRSITGKNVSRVVGEALRRAGIDATCHQLRHWYGTQALRGAGGNLRTAQQLMRHASPATTAIYTKVDNAEMRAAIDALPVPLHVVR